VSISLPLVSFYVDQSSLFRYVFQVVVPKPLAPKELVQVYESGEMVVLPPWDPMVRLLFDYFLNSLFNYRLGCVGVILRQGGVYCKVCINQQITPDSQILIYAIVYATSRYRHYMPCWYRHRLVAHCGAALCYLPTAEFNQRNRISRVCIVMLPQSSSTTRRTGIPRSDNTAMIGL
jgi:hypothetical protein